MPVTSPYVGLLSRLQNLSTYRGDSLKLVCFPDAGVEEQSFDPGAIKNALKLPKLEKHMRSPHLESMGAN